MSEILKILVLCAMFKHVYEKTHLVAIALAEVRLIDDHINDQGAMMLTTIVLPVRATLPPSILFADRALLHRGYSISEPNALVETVSKYKGLH